MQEIVTMRRTDLATVESGPDNPSGRPDPKRIDSEMSEQEKEELLDQVEQFEGPDRREIRGEHPEAPDNTGVSSS
jgi:hypothetical protein